ATARARSPSRSAPSTSPRIGPTSSSPAPLRERPKRRFRIVVGALGGIAVATSPTQRQRCAARDQGTPAKYPRPLLGVIRLNTERHQLLSDPLVLICILWSQRLCERVPQLLENNYQLLGRDVLLMRFTGNFPQQIRQFRCWPIGTLQLLCQRCPQLLHCAFRE